jgi:GNAT superfamily N-acetyltransferase
MQPHGDGGAIRLNSMIRRAKPEEARMLTEITLRSKAYWGYDQSFLDSARPDLEFHPGKFSPDFHVYVLQLEGKPVGYCSLIPMGKDVVELHDLFVEPGHIGKGHGMELWEYAVRLARSLGFRKLVLTVDPKAEAFYARQGAVRTGEKESPVGQGRVLPLMESLIPGE